MRIKTLVSIVTIVTISIVTGYSQNSNKQYVESWVTNADRSALFQKQTDSVFFGTSRGGAVSHRQIPVIKQSVSPRTRNPRESNELQ